MIRIMRAAAGVAFAFAFVPAAVAVADCARKELIGARVYAADGVEVGRVTDVSITGNHIDAVRVSRDAPLGLGERIVIIPQPAFMIRGRRVVFPDLRAEDVDLFPDASTLDNSSDDR